MKKYVFCTVIFMVTVIFSVMLYMTNTSNESKEVKRLANENYKLRNEIMRLKVTEEDNVEIVANLEKTIEIIQLQVVKLSEREDFEHYKMIKAHIMNPQANEVTSKSSKNGIISDEKELRIILECIVDQNTFDEFITSLAEEKLIVIDHLTRSLDRLIKEEERTDEFIEYIHNFRVRVTIEKSYIISRFKYMLMSQALCETLNAS